MYPTLQDFVRALEGAGELRRVSSPVSPVLEIAALADRESKSPAPKPASLQAMANDPRHHHLGGRALLFENVRGSDVPVLINTFGSYSRMEMALGVDEATLAALDGRTPAVAGFERIAAEIAELVRPEPPQSIGDALAKARRLAPLLRVPPRRRRGMGACQEVVRTGDGVDLCRWPLIRCWPLDGDLAAVGYPEDVNAGIAGLGNGPEWERDFRGRYVTLGGIHTIHADDRDHPRPPSHNIGMYRVQLLGPRRMAMHWHVHHDGARHWRSWKALGRPMPVAIALGGEAVLPYAATAPLPPGISELLMAGFLNRRGIEMCRGRTVPLWVPASAEIVIEGYVAHEAGAIGYDPRRADAGPLGPGAVFEGPFGDHTGFYSLPDRYPILEVTAITHRRRPIYPTTIVGLPPQEDYFLGKATERVFLPLLRTLVPDIADYDLPMFGAFHNAAFVKIRKEYAYQARRIMHAIWGAGQMSWTKTVVVVDEDVDVHDTFAVLRAVGERCVPARDAEHVRGPLDILDHAAPFLGAGAKMGLDATRKRGDAETHRALDGIAADLCAAGEIGPVLGESARATEARAARLAGVLGARIPEELGGWWLFVRAEAEDRSASAGADASPGGAPVAAARRAAGLVRALGALPNEVELPRWTVIVGPDAELEDTESVLFHWTANSCPERDRTESVCGRRVVFDARPKRPGVGAKGLPIRDWPPMLRAAP